MLTPKPGVWLCAFILGALQPSVRVCGLHAFSFFAQRKENMMKQTVFALMLAASASASQTNWLTSVSWYRDVGGQLYNTEKSVKFEAFGGMVKQVLPNAIVLQQVYTVAGNSIPLPDGNGGNVWTIPKLKTVYGDKIFITNFPDALQPTTGSMQHGRAMRIGTVRFGGDMLQLWDYGTPHRVAVVTTNTIAKRP
jgi:hypothetical protein